MDEDINLFTNGMVELDLADDNTLQRRELLKGAGTLTVWLAASNLSAAPTAPPEGKVPEAKPGPAEFVREIPTGYGTTMLAATLYLDAAPVCYAAP